MLELTTYERSILNGEAGCVGDQMALQIVTKTAEMLGAKSLVPIVSSHIDGCLYHGDSGVLFCEKLADEGARVKVPTTTNVGALNLLKPEQARVPEERRNMAFRLMQAHNHMGCKPTWTCAPYQAGARPPLGSQVAWGESNAVAFVNTVLGARTNRYGDFLDIACAITARAPYYGLHLEENRQARLLIDTGELSSRLKSQDAFYPVLGAFIGKAAGETVPVVTGISPNTTEDQLKALCAGAASTGALALIHIVGVTPEAPDLATAMGGDEQIDTINVTSEMIRSTRNSLSLAGKGPIDCVALGSPHFSVDECRTLLQLAKGRKFTVPIYICLGRHTMIELEKDSTDKLLLDAGVEFVLDTCVVVTPILPTQGGVLMTNSAKFAHYAMGNIGYKPVFGTLSDCVESAVKGHVIWNQDTWS
ncbi:MAG: putative aconitase [Parasphingorhabdus sp.]|jgi:predicted aconitase